MKLLVRLASVVETTATLGPVTAAGVLLTTMLSAVLLGFRLVTQGYYRFLFSSK
jgi:hypothetical protein